MQYHDSQNRLEEHLVQKDFEVSDPFDSVVDQIQMHATPEFTRIPSSNRPPLSNRCGVDQLYMSARSPTDIKGHSIVDEFPKPLKPRSLSVRCFELEDLTNQSLSTLKPIGRQTNKEVRHTMQTHRETCQWYRQYKDKEDMPKTTKLKSKVLRPDSKEWVPHWQEYWTLIIIENSQVQIPVNTEVCKNLPSKDSFRDEILACGSLSVSHYARNRCDGTFGQMMISPTYPDSTKLFKRLMGGLECLAWSEGCYNLIIPCEELKDNYEQSITGMDYALQQKKSQKLFYHKVKRQLGCG